MCGGPMSKLVPGSTDWCAVAEELAAKVRGYFTNRYGKLADFNSIPAKMDGDRDLYNLASRLTKKKTQPAAQHK